MQFPGKDEGFQVFLEDKQRFIEAVLLRMAELSEPGRTFNKDENKALGRLLQQIHFLEAPPERSQKVIPPRHPIRENQELSASGRPPHRLPNLHREYYLREPIYFESGGDSSEERLEALARFHRLAAWVTTRVVVRWADRYEAFPRGSAEAIPPAERRREGSLPPTLQAREALIEELLNWFERSSVELYMAVLNLYEGNQPLLYQSRGIPGELNLTTEEFAELQQAWELEGLPRDLYYLASVQRTIIEPIKTLGGVIRAYQHYSPLQWERRLQASFEPLLVPSEEERFQTFIAACKQFSEALLLRIAKLSERGQELDREQIQRLRNLHQEVNLAALRYEALLPDDEGHSD